MKQMKPFAGKWRIVELEVWDQDYVDMEVPGYILIGRRLGWNRAVSVRPGIRGYRWTGEPWGNTLRFDFSWSGQEEYDPVRGRGWAVIESGVLNGRIYLHLADDSALRAIKSK